MTHREESLIRVSDIIVNGDMKSAFFNELDLKLTKTEFELLRYLASNRNRTVCRDELLEKIWGFGCHAETRATDDAIKRIRRKISLCGSSLKIETVRGYGFIIKD